MNQQQYRLLCMDIDGTLLNSAHKLPLANREAVQFAAKNGVTICLMSARPPRAVFPIRDALGVDGPLVCCGGGLILSGENRLADSRLTRAFPERAKALFARNEQVANDRYEHLTRLVELYK